MRALIVTSALLALGHVAVGQDSRPARPRLPSLDVWRSMEASAALDVLIEQDFWPHPYVEYFARRCDELDNPRYVPKLWRILQRVLNPADIHTRTSQPYIEAICRLGDQQDREKLLAMCRYQRMGQWKAAFLAPLSETWIAREVDRLSSHEKASVSAPAAHAAELPPYLVNAPPILQEAWSRAAPLLHDYDALTRGNPEDDWISFQDNEGLFFSTIERFLAGDRANVLGTIRSFRWGTWCGTFSEQLLIPQNRTMVMALLAEKRYRLALGGMLRFERIRQQELIECHGPACPQLAAWCGEDWVQLCAGAAIDGESGSYEGYLHSLVRAGTPRAAEYLLAMDTLPNMPPHDRVRYIRVLSAFITPGSTRAAGLYYSNPYARKSCEPIPDELQSRMLDVVCRCTEPGGERRVIENAAQALAWLCRPVTREALRRAYLSEYPDAHRPAMLALRALGEEAPDLPNRGPVRLRVLVNGEPAPGHEIHWEVDTGASSSARLGADGSFTLDRGYFVDRSKPASGVAIRSPRLRIKKLGEDLVFARIDVPAELNETVDVPLTLAPLVVRFRLDGPRTRFAGRPATVKLMGKPPLPGGGTQRFFENLTEPIKGAVGAELLVARVPPGTYKVQVQIPGAARWSSPEITVTASGGRAEALLEPGGDLRFRLQTPGGLAGPHETLGARLRSNGRIVPLYRHLDLSVKDAVVWRGLPAGEYELQIPSTDELEELEPAQGGGKAVIPGFPGYYGKHVPFVIPPDGTDVIDLGVIMLPALPPKQAPNEAAGLR
ncbi:MAG: hypothetical protein AMXMBFR13_43550 [Phycisphaerae bacterium]